MVSHVANIKTSRRLQRVLAVLSDMAWHTTREIIHKTDCCAINSIIHELRRNNYNIKCECLSAKGDSRIYQYKWIKAEDFPEHEKQGWTLIKARRWLGGWLSVLVRRKGE